MSMEARQKAFWFIIPLIMASFIFFGGNRFTTFNLIVWGAALLFTLWALWEPAEKRGTTCPSLSESTSIWPDRP
jgi:hypothetical protein